jgi:hypothetical protein
MKKTLLIAIAALMIPGVALAKANPGHGKNGVPGTHGRSAPKVLYILKGTLSGYSAYDSATSTPGSVTIVVGRANYHGKALKGQTLTFPTGAATKITLENGATTITDGDRGIVKIRAFKRIAAADLASTLQASSARQVLDHGASR